MQEGKKTILKLTKEKIEVLEVVGFEWKCGGSLSKHDLNSSMENSPDNTFLLVGEKINSSSSHVVESEKDSYDTGTTIEDDKKD